MPAMIDKSCKHCSSTIRVRLADHRRGWGNFCNKSCKAKRTGQYAAYKSGRGVSNLHPERLKDYDDTHPFSSGALGQW